MIFGFLEADSMFSHNQEFLTEDKYGNSLRYVDRSYKENNVKISYTSKQKTNSLGCSISQRNRIYLSNNDFTVNYGKLIKGNCSKLIMGNSSGSLIHVISNDIGLDTTKKFIYDIQDVTRLFIL